MIAGGRPSRSLAVFIAIGLSCLLASCGYSYIVPAPVIAPDEAIAPEGLPGHYRLIEDPPEPVTAEITAPAPDLDAGPRYGLSVTVDGEESRWTEELMMRPLDNRLYLAQGRMPEEQVADHRALHRDPMLRSEAYYYLYFFDRIGSTVRILQPSDQGYAAQEARAQDFGIRLVTHRYDSMFSTIERYLLGPPEAIFAWLKAVGREDLRPPFVFARRHAQPGAKARD